MAPPATRRNREFPQQRARETYQRLLDAAARVFSEKGFDAAQTPDIAQVAGVSVGTFYRYFGDKRQAFVEMITAHLEEVYSLINEQLTPDAFSGSLSPQERRAAVGLVLDVLFRHAAVYPELHRVFLGMSLRDDEVGRIRSEYEQRGRDNLATLIAQVVPSSHVPDPQAAAEVIQIASSEVAISSFGGRGDERGDGDSAALRDALATMVHRYLFAF